MVLKPFGTGVYIPGKGFQVLSHPWTTLTQEDVLANAPLYQQYMKDTTDITIRQIDPSMFVYDINKSYDENQESLYNTRSSLMETHDGVLEELCITPTAVYHIIADQLVARYAPIDATPDPIMTAFWCRLSEESLGERWICIVTASRLCFFSSEGDEHSTLLPFRISGAWPLQVGVLLQRETEHNVGYADTSSDASHLALSQAQYTNERTPCVLRQHTCYVPPEVQPSSVAMSDADSVQLQTNTRDAKPPVSSSSSSSASVPFPPLPSRPSSSLPPTSSLPLTNLTIDLNTTTSTTTTATSTASYTHALSTLPVPTHRQIPALSNRVLHTPAGLPLLNISDGSGTTTTSYMPQDTHHNLSAHDGSNYNQDDNCNDLDDIDDEEEPLPTLFSITRPLQAPRPLAVEVFRHTLPTHASSTSSSSMLDLWTGARESVVWVGAEHGCILLYHAQTRRHSLLLLRSLGEDTQMAHTHALATALAAYARASGAGLRDGEAGEERQKQGEEDGIEGLFLNQSSAQANVGTGVSGNPGISGNPAVNSGTGASAGTGTGISIGLRLGALPTDVDSLDVSSASALSVRNLSRVTLHGDLRSGESLHSDLNASTASSALSAATLSARAASIMSHSTVSSLYDEESLHNDPDAVEAEDSDLLDTTQRSDAVYCEMCLCRVWAGPPGPRATKAFIALDAVPCVNTSLESVATELASADVGVPRVDASAAKDVEGEGGEGMYDAEDSGAGASADVSVGRVEIAQGNERLGDERGVGVDLSACVLDAGLPEAVVQWAVQHSHPSDNSTSTSASTSSGSGGEGEGMEFVRVRSVEEAVRSGVCALTEVLVMHVGSAAVMYALKEKGEEVAEVVEIEEEEEDGEEVVAVDGFDGMGGDDNDDQCDDNRENTGDDSLDKNGDNLGTFDDNEWNLLARIFTALDLARDAAVHSAATNTTTHTAPSDPASALNTATTSAAIAHPQQHPPHSSPPSLSSSSSSSAAASASLTPSSSSSACPCPVCVLGSALAASPLATHLHACATELKSLVRPTSCPHVRAQAPAPTQAHAQAQREVHAQIEPQAQAPAHTRGGDGDGGDCVCVRAMWMRVVGTCGNCADTHTHTPQRHHHHHPLSHTQQQPQQQQSCSPSAAWQCPCPVFAAFARLCVHPLPLLSLGDLRTHAQVDMNTQTPTSSSSSLSSVSASLSSTLTNTHTALSPLPILSPLAILSLPPVRAVSLITTVAADTLASLAHDTQHFHLLHTQIPGYTRARPFAAAPMSLTALGSVPCDSVARAPLPLSMAMLHRGHGDSALTLSPHHNTTSNSSSTITHSNNATDEAGGVTNANSASNAEAGASSAAGGRGDSVSPAGGAAGSPCLTSALYLPLSSLPSNISAPQPLPITASATPTLPPPLPSGWRPMRVQACLAITLYNELHYVMAGVSLVKHTLPALPRTPTDAAGNMEDALADTVSDTLAASTQTIYPTLSLLTPRFLLLSPPSLSDSPCSSSPLLLFHTPLTLPPECTYLAAALVAALPPLLCMRVLALVEEATDVILNTHNTHTFPSLLSSSLCSPSALSPSQAWLTALLALLCLWPFAPCTSTPTSARTQFSSTTTSTSTSTSTSSASSPSSSSQAAAPPPLSPWEQLLATPLFAAVNASLPPITPLRSPACLSSSVSALSTSAPPSPLHVTLALRLSSLFDTLAPTPLLLPGLSPLSSSPTPLSTCLSRAAIRSYFPILSLSLHVMTQDLALSLPLYFSSYQPSSRSSITQFGTNSPCLPLHLSPLHFTLAAILGKLQREDVIQALSLSPCPLPRSSSSSSSFASTSSSTSSSPPCASAPPSASYTEGLYTAAYGTHAHHPLPLLYSLARTHTFLDSSSSSSRVLPPEWLTLLPPLLPLPKLLSHAQAHTLSSLSNQYNTTILATYPPWALLPPLCSPALPSLYPMLLLFPPPLHDHALLSRQLLLLADIATLRVWAPSHKAMRLIFQTHNTQADNAPTTDIHHSHADNAHPHPHSPFFPSLIDLSTSYALPPLPASPSTSFSSPHTRTRRSPHNRKSRLPRQPVTAAPVLTRVLAPLSPFAAYKHALAVPVSVRTVSASDVPMRGYSDAAGLATPSLHASLPPSAVHSRIASPAPTPAPLPPSLAASAASMAPLSASSAFSPSSSLPSHAPHTPHVHTRTPHTRARARTQTTPFLAATNTVGTAATAAAPVALAVGSSQWALSSPASMHTQTHVYTQSRAQIQTQIATPAPLRDTANHRLNTSNGPIANTSVNYHHSSVMMSPHTTTTHTSFLHNTSLQHTRQHDTSLSTRVLPSLPLTLISLPVPSQHHAHTHRFFPLSPSAIPTKPARIDPLILASPGKALPKPAFPKPNLPEAGVPKSKSNIPGSGFPAQNLPDGVGTDAHVRTRHRTRTVAGTRTPRVRAATRSFTPIAVATLPSLSLPLPPALLSPLLLILLLSEQIPLSLLSSLPSSISLSILAALRPALHMLASLSDQAPSPSFSPSVTSALHAALAPLLSLPDALAMAGLSPSSLSAARRVADDVAISVALYTATAAVQRYVDEHVLQLAGVTDAVYPAADAGYHSIGGDHQAGDGAYGAGVGIGDDAGRIGTEYGAGMLDTSTLHLPTHMHASVTNTNFANDTHNTTVFTSDAHNATVLARDARTTALLHTGADDSVEEAGDVVAVVTDTARHRPRLLGSNYLPHACITLLPPRPRGRSGGVGVDGDVEAGEACGVCSGCALHNTTNNHGNAINNGSDSWSSGTHTASSHPGVALDVRACSIHAAYTLLLLHNLLQQPLVVTLARPSPAVLCSHLLAPARVWVSDDGVIAHTIGSSSSSSAATGLDVGASHSPMSSDVPVMAVAPSFSIFSETNTPAGSATALAAANDTSALSIPTLTDPLSRLSFSSSRLFPHDTRMSEFARLLSSSRHCSLYISPSRLEALLGAGIDADQAIQMRLLLLAHRTLALPLARGLATLSLSSTPLSTSHCPPDFATLPPITLDAVLRPHNTVVELAAHLLDPPLTSLRLWPETYNAVAQALSLPFAEAAVARVVRMGIASSLLARATAGLNATTQSTTHSVYGMPFSSTSSASSPLHPHYDAYGLGATQAPRTPASAESTTSLALQALSSAAPRSPWSAGGAAWVNTLLSIHPPHVVGGLIAGVTLAGHAPLTSAATILSLLRRGDDVLTSATLFSLCVHHRATSHPFVARLLSLFLPPTQDAPLADPRPGAIPSILLACTAPLCLGLLGIASSQPTPTRYLLSHVRATCALPDTSAQRTRTHTSTPRELGWGAAGPPGPRAPTDASVVFAQCYALGLLHLSRPSTPALIHTDAVPTLLSLALPHTRAGGRTLSNPAPASWAALSAGKGTQGRPIPLALVPAATSCAAAWLALCGIFLHTRDASMMALLAPPASLAEIEAALPLTHLFRCICAALVRGECPTDEEWVEEVVGSCLMGGVGGYVSSDHARRQKLARAQAREEMKTHHHREEVERKQESSGGNGEPADADVDAYLTRARTRRHTTHNTNRLAGTGASAAMGTSAATGMGASAGAAMDDNDVSNTTNAALAPSYLFAVAGAMLGMGLTHAGSANDSARAVISHYLDCMLATRARVEGFVGPAFATATQGRYVASLERRRGGMGMGDGADVAQLYWHKLPLGTCLSTVDALTLEQCIATTTAALALVMAGTCDSATLAQLRRARYGPSAALVYLQQVSVHTAIGLLCLGGGRFSLDASPLSKYWLLGALLPTWALSPADVNCYPPWLRQLTVLAAVPRAIAVAAPATTTATGSGAGAAGSTVTTNGSTGGTRTCNGSVTLDFHVRVPTYTSPTPTCPAMPVWVTQVVTTSTPALTPPPALIMRVAARATAHGSAVPHTASVVPSTASMTHYAASVCAWWSPATDLAHLHALTMERTLCLPRSLPTIHTYLPTSPLPPPSATSTFTSTSSLFVDPDIDISVGISDHTHPELALLTRANALVSSAFLPRLMAHVSASHTSSTTTAVSAIASGAHAMTLTATRDTSRNTNTLLSSTPFLSTVSAHTFALLHGATVHSDVLLAARYTASAAVLGPLTWLLACRSALGVTPVNIITSSPPHHVSQCLPVPAVLRTLLSLAPIDSSLASTLTALLPAHTWTSLLSQLLPPQSLSTPVLDLLDAAMTNTRRARSSPAPSPSSSAYPRSLPPSYTSASAPPRRTRGSAAVSSRASPAHVYAYNAALLLALHLAFPLSVEHPSHAHHVCRSSTSAAPTTGGTSTSTTSVTTSGTITVVTAADVFAATLDSVPSLYRAFAAAIHSVAQLPDAHELHRCVMAVAMALNVPVPAPVVPPAPLSGSSAYCPQTPCTAFIDAARTFAACIQYKGSPTGMSTPISGAGTSTTGTGISAAALCALLAKEMGVGVRAAGAAVAAMQLTMTIEESLEEDNM